MSQIKKLESDLSYLERFISDIQKIKGNVSTRDVPVSYDQACEDLFKKVRDYAENEITRMTEPDKNLAQNLQNFVNPILKIIIDTRQRQHDEIQKVKHQTDLMEELLAATLKSQSTLQAQIEDLKEKEEIADTIMTSPPVRERPNIRKVGEKPKKVSDREG